MKIVNSLVGPWKYKGDRALASLITPAAYERGP